MRGHSVTICVICGERFGHHQRFGREAFAVGRKLSGVKRMVCGRAGCRKRWQRDGQVLKARWAENRQAA